MNLGHQKKKCAPNACHNMAYVKLHTSQTGILLLRKTAIFSRILKFCYNLKACPHFCRTWQNLWIYEPYQEFRSQTFLQFILTANLNLPLLIRYLIQLINHKALTDTYDILPNWYCSQILSKNILEEYKNPQNFFEIQSILDLLSDHSWPWLSCLLQSACGSRI